MNKKIVLQQESRQQDGLLRHKVSIDKIEPQDQYLANSHIVLNQQHIKKKQPQKESAVKSPFNQPTKKAPKHKKQNSLMNQKMMALILAKNDEIYSDGDHTVDEHIQKTQQFSAGNTFQLDPAVKKTVDVNRKFMVSVSKIILQESKKKIQKSVKNSGPSDRNCSVDSKRVTNVVSGNSPGTVSGSIKASKIISSSFDNTGTNIRVKKKVVQNMQPQKLIIVPNQQISRTSVGSSTKMKIIQKRDEKKSSVASGRYVDASKGYTLESQLTENNAGLGDTQTPIIPKQGKMKQLLKKSAVKGKSFAIGPATKTVGLPTNIHSGLVTQGNVTKVAGTGIQSMVKQSFSDLHEAVEVQHNLGTVDDRYNGQHFEDPSQLSGPMIMNKGQAQNPAHNRVKSDANYIMAMHQQQNKNFIISSSNHVYASKKNQNIRMHQANQAVSNQGATKGLLLNQTEYGNGGQSQSTSNQTSKRGSTSGNKKISLVVSGNRKAVRQALDAQQADISKLEQDFISAHNKTTEQKYQELKMAYNDLLSKHNQLQAQKTEDTRRIQQTDIESMYGNIDSRRIPSREDSMANSRQFNIQSMDNPQIINNQRTELKQNKPIEIQANMGSNQKNEDGEVVSSGFTTSKLGSQQNVIQNFQGNKMHQHHFSNGSSDVLVYNQNKQALASDADAAELEFNRVLQSQPVSYSHTPRTKNQVIRTEHLPPAVYAKVKASNDLKVNSRTEGQANVYLQGNPNFAKHHNYTEEQNGSKLSGKSSISNTALQANIYQSVGGHTNHKRSVSDGSAFKNVQFHKLKHKTPQMMIVEEGGDQQVEYQQPFDSNNYMDFTDEENIADEQQDYEPTMKIDPQNYQAQKLQDFESNVQFELKINKKYIKSTINENSTPRKNQREEVSQKKIKSAESQKEFGKKKNTRGQTMGNAQDGLKMNSMHRRVKSGVPVSQGVVNSTRVVSVSKTKKHVQAKFQQVKLPEPQAPESQPNSNRIIDMQALSQMLQGDEKAEFHEYMDSRQNSIEIVKEEQTGEFGFNGQEPKSGKIVNVSFNNEMEQSSSHDYEDQPNNEMPAPKAAHIEYLNPVNKKSKHLSNFLEQIKKIKPQMPVPQKLDDRTKSVEVDQFPSRLVCEPSQDMIREKNSFSRLDKNVPKKTNQIPIKAISGMSNQQRTEKYQKMMSKVKSHSKERRVTAPSKVGQHEEMLMNAAKQTVVRQPSRKSQHRIMSTNFDQVGGPQDLLTGNADQMSFGIQMTGTRSIQKDEDQRPNFGAASQKVGQSSQKQMKILLVGEKELVDEQKKKHPRHKVSKSNAIPQQFINNRLLSEDSNNSRSAQPPLQNQQHQRINSFNPQGRPQQILNSKIQFNAPMMMKQQQKYTGSTAPHDFSKQNSYSFPNDSSSLGQPSPIISTKRVPQKVLEQTGTQNTSLNVSPDPNQKQTLHNNFFNRQEDAVEEGSEHITNKQEYETSEHIVTDRNITMEDQQPDRQANEVKNKKVQKLIQPTQKQRLVKQAPRRQSVEGSMIISDLEDNYSSVRNEANANLNQPVISQHQAISIIEDSQPYGDEEDKKEDKDETFDQSFEKSMLIHNLNKSNQFPFELRVEKGPLQSERYHQGERSMRSDRWSERRGIRNETENSIILPQSVPKLTQMSERMITEESSGAANLTPRSKQIRKLIKLIRMSFMKNQTPPNTTVDFYRIGKVLGKGAFGKVNLAVHKLTQCLCAVKSINKTCFSDESQTKKVMQEVVMLKRTRHKNIVRLYEYFESDKYILMVIEVCAGGDLLNYVRRRRRLKEDVAKCLFKQLIESLAYCHNKNILHRDIKLDNILLDATGQVKLCDFGVGKIVKPGEKLTEQCGTPAYIAPEILSDKGYTGYAVDIWSAGVVLFAMLYGTVPFKAANMNDLQAIILAADYTLKDDITPEARDLIQGLLEKDPKKRLTAGQILCHSWMKDCPDPSHIELFTEQEKQYIKQEFFYNKSTRFGRNTIGPGIFSPPNDNDDLMTDAKDMFTEHLLDSVQNNLQKNSETKSVILAPFNSTKRSNLNENGELKQIELSDSVKELIESKNIIKFGPKVRDIDRQYEINNNADLDNGVYHKQDDENSADEFEGIKPGQDQDKPENDEQEDQEIMDELKRQEHKEKDTELQKLNNMIDQQEKQVVQINMDKIKEQRAINQQVKDEYEVNCGGNMVTENSAQNLHEIAPVQGPTCQIKIIETLSENDSGEDHETVLFNLLVKQISEEKIEIKDKIIEIVETYGYPKDWIVKSLNNQDLNYATTAYLLLHFQNNANEILKTRRSYADSVSQ